MAFRRRKSKRATIDSPEALFRDLRNRSVEGLLSHQADILRRYQGEALDVDNVAIELPTGSGKTLVGLLIAEFRRVTRNERVLYVCPTKQLVKQVVLQSEEKYGIKATAFTGKVKEYPPNDKARYQTGETIAVAPYSALFNTNPFFDNSQLIILDDAHSAENYVAANWSLRIERSKNPDLYSGLLELLADAIPPGQLARFREEKADYTTFGWIEHVPLARMAEHSEELASFLDVHTAETRLRYPWQLLQGHLHACVCYVSYREILIRPYIPPTMTHHPFADAKQRVFMSATLGSGGDLERITGVRKLVRLPIPAGWDKQGIGRRFFLFPGLSLDDKDVPNLVVDMVRKSGRALSLVPSDRDAKKHDELFKAAGIPTVHATDIEESKDAFTSLDSCVAVLANRYDGIDLMADECRLLIIEGLPKASNLQELFLLSRMACGTLLHDRIRTRIIQAVGRCTRSATDYAAVCVIGDDFHEWLVLQERRAIYHPELQGELEFGVEQSRDSSASETLANLRVFLEHGDDWDAVDTDILEYRDEATQVPIAGQDELMNAAPLEVDHQYAIWDEDYERALELSQQIASEFSGDVLKGLRGLWYYFGASSSHALHSRLGSDIHRAKAAELYRRASHCALALSWLRDLSHETTDVAVDDTDLMENERLLNANVERIESVFESQSYTSSRRFERDAKEILAGLNSDDSKKFEPAQVRLGELLGFECDNKESTSASDPWWISAGVQCLVFEDKSDSKPENAIPVKHAKQAASHPQWIQKHVPLNVGADVHPVLVSPQTTIDKEVPTFANGVSYWNIEEFRKWARDAISTLRELRATFTGSGSVEWRTEVAQGLIASHLDPQSIIARARATPLSDLPKI